MTVSQTANPLGYEQIGRLLRRFAIPSVISLIINSLYNMVDQIFIGQGVGFLGNGATNIIAPITIIAIALSALFGDGLAAYFSLHLGKGEPEKAASGVGNALLGSSVVSILLMILAFSFLEPLCLFFGATDTLMPYALGYGSIIVLGFPFVIIGTVINSVIRADGSPRYAMFAMMIGALLNILLDPLFIFVFHWGVEGAALATIISQGVGMLCNIIYLFHFKNIHLTRHAFAFHLSLIGHICALGFAGCFNNLTSTVVAFVSNNLLTQYGALSEYGADIPITTFGLCMKISMLALSLAIGVASGSQPIIGFNYGAHHFDRVKKAFLLSVCVSTIIATLSWLVFQLFPLQLIRIFGTESSLYEDFAVQCFHIYLMLTMLNGLQLCAGVFFQAIGQPVKATVVSLSKQLLFYVPAMIVLARFFGLTGILLAGPVADALAFTLSLILCLRELRKLEHLSKNTCHSLHAHATHSSSTVGLPSR
ncbi:MAG: MATE family efflux transporter [Peptococcaceae bacterium]|nr:MATE family efflux transporter [Peptococcaceae bacterium]